MIASAMQKTIHHSAKPARRRGSLIVELVIMSALFATALIALGKMSQASAKLNIEADRRLASRLLAENVLDRLAAAPIEKLKLVADTEMDADHDGFAVQIVQAECKIAGKQAVHVSVTASPKSDSDSAISVTLHDWRLLNVNSGDAASEEDEQ